MDLNLESLKMISVVIPVNRFDNWAASAISSCLLGGEPIELILVLSRSLTTESEGIQAQLKELGIETFKVVVQKGEGIADALNDGVLESSYELIARLDADDLMCEGRLKAQRELLESNHKLVAVGGQVSVINLVGEVIRTIYRPLSDASIRRQIVFGNCLTHSAVMFRKSVFFKIGGYDTKSHAEDFDLWTRMLKYGKINNLPQVVCCSRMHNGQLSQSNRKKVALSTLQTIKMNISQNDYGIDGSIENSEVTRVKKVAIFLKTKSFYRIAKVRNSMIWDTTSVAKAILDLLIAFAYWPPSLFRYARSRYF
jgi:glycosyltransferase involved in cell wall biosynthesis